MSTITPRPGRVTIYQGDDLARLADLDEAVAAAEQAVLRAERAAKDKARTGGPLTLDEVDDPAAEAIEARASRDAAIAERDGFAAEAEARGVTVVMHHLPRKTWRALRAAHPPREGNEEDAAFDVNVDTMPDELLAKSIDPDESTVEGDLVEFLDSLSSHDYYNRLFMTALSLNVGNAGADPTLRLASASRQNFAATSSSPSAPSAPSTSSAPHPTPTTG